MVDHNKIITSVARPLLKAHNFKQKGVSRSFIQDNQWYSIFIEFQPYSYRKGTFLNVNACFHFYPKDYWSFDYGDRVHDFIEFKDEATFKESMEGLCQIAIIYSSNLKNNLKGFESAIEHYSRSSKGDEYWKAFNLGFLYGLAGDSLNASRLFKTVTKHEAIGHWDIERQNFCFNCLEALNNDNFNLFAKSVINQSRDLKKMPLVDL